MPHIVARQPRAALMLSRRQKECFGAGREWVSGQSAVQMMKFVVRNASNGQFRFNLAAGNGQVVATSESYTRKQSALDTIASIQKNAAAATVDDETN
jgi:hypothetical protein